MFRLTRFSHKLHLTQVRCCAINNNKIFQTVNILEGNYIDLSLQYNRLNENYINLKNDYMKKNWDMMQSIILLNESRIFQFDKQSHEKLITIDKLNDTKKIINKKYILKIKLLTNKRKRLLDKGILYMNNTSYILKHIDCNKHKIKNMLDEELKSIDTKISKFNIENNKIKSEINKLLNINNRLKM